MNLDGAGDGKIRLTVDEKKKNHIESEKKRRVAIRAQFERLSRFVPDCAGKARSEAFVLQKTVEMLKNALATKEELRKEKYDLGWTEKRFESYYQGKSVNMSKEKFLAMIYRAENKQYEVMEEANSEAESLLSGNNEAFRVNKRPRTGGVETGNGTTKSAQKKKKVKPASQRRASSDTKKQASPSGNDLMPPPPTPDACHEKRSDPGFQQQDSLPATGNMPAYRYPDPSLSSAYPQQLHHYPAAQVGYLQNDMLLAARNKPTSGIPSDLGTLVDIPRDSSLTGYGSPSSGNS